MRKIKCYQQDQMEIVNIYAVYNPVLDGNRKDRKKKENDN